MRLNIFVLNVMMKVLVSVCRFRIMKNVRIVSIYKDVTAKYLTGEVVKLKRL